MTSETLSRPVFREVVPTDEFIPNTETRRSTMRLHPHFGQMNVLDCLRRFIMMFAGTQVGKTCLGVHWMHREIQQCGAGDYIIVTATFPLLKMKLLPEFQLVFEDILHLGKYSKQDKTFYVSKQGELDLFGEKQEVETRVIFGSAENPESLESATAKAAWLDELGQKQFRRESWDAVLRRLSLFQGRVLGTTTLYVLGWLKSQVYDKIQKGEMDGEIIQCDSIANPMFPKEEYYEAKSRLPKWKFNLFYRGIYDKPAGLIYDEFDEERQVITRKAFEAVYQRNWQVYVGHDFGGVNPSALFYARDPVSNDLYLFKEYKPENKDANEQVADLLDTSKDMRIVRAVGGSHQEDGWRLAYTNAGWKIYEPRTSRHGVEAQIDKVYGIKKQGRLFVVEDCYGYLDENATFSRKLDDNYEPTDQIDSESTYHYMAAERYVVSDFVASHNTEMYGVPDDDYPSQVFY